MLFTNRTTGRITRIAGCMVLLAVAFIWSGCGSDSEEFSEDDITLKVREEKTENREVNEIPAPEEDSITGAQVEDPDVEEAGREVSYADAEGAYLEGEYSRAVDLFSAYTEQKEENPWGYYMLGLSAWKSRDFELAEDSFNKALELDPDHPKSRINLGRVYLDTGRAAEALELIAAAGEQMDESATAHHLTGRAYRQIGETEKAIDAYRKAIQIDNTQVWAMNNLGLIFIREGRFEEAVPPLARAAVIRDDLPVFQNNLGIALENTGHYREAENAYAAAVTMDKDYDRAYNNLCRVELLQEDANSAEIDLAEMGESFIERINSLYEPGRQAEAAAAAEASDSSITAGLETLVTVAAGADSTAAE